MKIRVGREKGVREESEGVWTRIRVEGMREGARECGKEGGRGLRLRK